MKLRWQVAIGFGAICLIATAAVLIYRKTSLTELDRYKAELRAKGEKLTLAELLPPQTNEPISLAPLKDAARELSAATFRPDDIRWFDYSGPGTVNPLSQKPHLPGYDSKGTNETIAAEWVSLEKEIAQLEPALERIREFVRKRPRHIGGQELTVFSTFNGYAFVEQRDAGRWLLASAMKNLHSGDTQGFISDLDALLCLAEMHSKEPLLINQLIRRVIADTAFTPTWEGLTVVTGWIDADLAKLQENWARIDCLRGLALGLECERNFGIELIGAIKEDSANYQRLFGGGMGSLTGTAADDAVLALWRGTVSHQDQLFSLRFMQSVIELHRRFIETQNWSAVHGAHEQLLDQTESHLYSWRGQTLMMSRMTMPSLRSALKGATRSEVQKRMCITVIALKRHQLKHGSLPTDLQALVPEFLPAVPIDCMNGQTLRYQPQTDGSFLLYSVGEDGKDDGGDPTPSDPKAKKLDMWSGRDVVWPKPAIANVIE